MKYFSFTSLRSVAAKVDREKGMIFGVSLITIGEARGHDMEIDQTTLEQVMNTAKEYKSGLRVSFNPDTFQHGPGGVPGFILASSIRIEGESVIGDMKVMKSYAHRDYLFDLAEEQPDTFGLSIEFSGPPEEIDGVKFARCEEIFAAAVVDEPAANERGLFRAQDEPAPTKPKANSMTTEEKDELKAMFGEVVKPLSARLDKFESDINGRFTALESASKLAEADKEPDCTGMSAIQVASERRLAGVVEGDSQIAINRKVNKFRADSKGGISRGELREMLSEHSMEIKTMLGNAPVGGNTTTPPGDEKDPVKKFNALVEKELKDGKFQGNRAKAMSFCAQQYPAEYKEFAKSRVQNHMMAGARN